VWRYLKSAFFVSVDVPSLGRIPVNVLAATAFGILGFAQPAFWLLGLAVEAAVVPALAFNPRFQKVVEAQSLERSQGNADQQRQTLVKLLEASAQKRLWDLAKKCNQILDVYRTQQAEQYIIDSNDQALKNLEWVYLKLLVARHHLMNPLQPPPKVQEQIQPQRIWAVGKGLFGLIVNFNENAVHSNRHGRAQAVQ